MRLRLLNILTLAVLCSTPTFSNDTRWENSVSHMYISFVDVSYAYSDGNNFALELLSFNFSTFPSPNKFYTGITVLDTEMNEKESELSFLRLNLYFNTFDIQTRNKNFMQLFDYFYISGYPINYKYKNSEFKYFPKVKIGNEMGLTQSIIPGTFGIGLEYILSNYLYNNEVSIDKDIRFKIFYKLGGSLLMP